MGRASTGLLPLLVATPARWSLHVTARNDSLGNPFVHSLLVTLGNHTVPDVQTYNWPCPVGPSADMGDDLPAQDAGAVS
jgi:hypothetical protein